MSDQPRTERMTQYRVISLFTEMARPDFLGRRFLDDWCKRANNGKLKHGMMKELFTVGARLI
jgi:type I restriction enzyme R subunit